MNKMLFIPKSDLLELLKQAFDAGWTGFQDLKEGAAETLLEQYLEEKKRKNAEAGRGIPVEVALEPRPEPAFMPDQRGSGEQAPQMVGTWQVQHDTAYPPPQGNWDYTSAGSVVVANDPGSSHPASDTQTESSDITYVSVSTTH